MAEPEAGDGRLGSPRPALPPKVAESLDDAELSDAWGPMQGSAPFHTWQSGVILDPAVPS